jgi:ABC-2 type transport system ATP-binding protein
VPEPLELPGVIVLAQDGARFTLELQPDARLPDVIRSLSEHHAIRDLSMLEPDIESTIRRIYEGDLLNVRPA